MLRSARLALWVVSLLATAVAAGMLAAPANANHVAGATYTGMHSAGGTVEFTVSSDGTQIATWRVTNVPSGSCTVSEARSRTTTAIAADHTFNFEEGGQLGSFFRGSFPSVGSASGTLKMTPIPAQLTCLTFASQTWTATTSARPPSPPPPRPTAFPPSFRGGADSVRFVRSGAGKRVVSVRAKFRACSGTSPFQLSVRQRRRVGTAVLAEARFRKRLTGGRPAPQGCRDYVVSWRLAAKFFGAGHVVITLVIVDAAGEESGAPQYALRAPRR